METHIATIQNNELENVLTWKELHAAKFGYDAAFKLQLADNQTLYVEQVLRLIPKRRMVGFAIWNDKLVVAKLFFDLHHAKRHMEQDAAGIQMLRENKIPTPALFYKGWSADKRVYVLLYERIFDGKSLHDIWETKTTIDEILPILKGVVVELATQHVLGVMQNDLHLKNFLLTRKTIFTLDGGDVELFPHILPKKMSMNNLALFLAQFGVGTEKYQELLFKHYASSRGWLLKDEDTIELFMLIKKWNDFRWQQYEKKIFRESTNFAFLNEWRRFGIYDRHYASADFMRFIEHPDYAFLREDTVTLKAGRSATVVRVRLGRQEFVIKRYNMKGFFHWLRRALRPTRAFKSWRLAQKLELFGVETAKPVAFIEYRCLGFRSKSYYVTEYVPGRDAGEYFAHCEPEETNTMVKRITLLLKNIAKLEITHGDLKITNILVNEKNEPVIIDLDGAVEHASLSSLRSAWRKETKRFLANFKKVPYLIEKFKKEFESK